MGGCIHKIYIALIYIYQLIMFSTHLLVQILNNVSDTPIMNWFETTQKFATATNTKDMTFWRIDETSMTQK